jgi:23S rRNA pseudouridine1911/1915/1917 synthase
LRKEKRKVSFNPQIIFEDDFLLVIDKPAGMVVNRAETTKNEETIQDWIERKFSREAGSRSAGDFPLANNDLLRNGVVHRLDKETSGLLIIAKTPESFANLQQQFKERKVKKKYLALVHGKVEPKEGAIEASLSRSPFDRKKFGVFLGGREAKTNYRVLDYLGSVKKEEFTLLALTPETGRTHQIRVHLKFIGHPIVGDEKYAGRKTARNDRKWCPRQFLHAAGLSFNHPATGKRIELVSELPSDLQIAMMKIRT